MYSTPPEESKRNLHLSSYSYVTKQKYTLLPVVGNGSNGASTIGTHLLPLQYRPQEILAPLETSTLLLHQTGKTSL